MGGEARKNKMKLEGEKCADESKTADVFCGSSSCISIAWNNPASCSPPTSPASVFMGENFLAEATLTNTGKKRERNQKQETALWRWDVSKVSQVILMLRELRTTAGE